MSCLCAETDRVTLAQSMSVSADDHVYLADDDVRELFARMRN